MLKSRYRLRHKAEIQVTRRRGRVVKHSLAVLVYQAVDQPVSRFCFSASKRTGNAVQRNRAKRRLREASRLVLPGAAEVGCDYVLIARSAVLTCSFQELIDDMTKAFERVLAVKPRRA